MGFGILQIGPQTAEIWANLQNLQKLNILWEGYKTHNKPAQFGIISKGFSWAFKRRCSFSIWTTFFQGTVLPSGAGNSKMGDFSGNRVKVGWMRSWPELYA